MSEATVIKFPSVEHLNWAGIVGGANAAYSRPESLDGTRLCVSAWHSVVRNELFLHRATIARLVSEALRAPVEDIHIVAVTIPGRERIEAELREQIALFNEGDPQTILESIKRIRELRVQLRQAPAALDPSEDGE
jgi:hypothetical protein